MNLYDLLEKWRQEYDLDLSITFGYGTKSDRLGNTHAEDYLCEITISDIMRGSYAEPFILWHEFVHCIQWDRVRRMGHGADFWKLWIRKPLYGPLGYILMLPTVIYRLLRYGGQGD